MVSHESSDAALIAWLSTMFIVSLAVILTILYHLSVILPAVFPGCIISEKFKQLKM
jgi:hypothetical protein